MTTLQTITIAPAPCFINPPATCQITQLPHLTSPPYKPVVGSPRPPGVCSPQVRTEPSFVALHVREPNAPPLRPSSASSPHDPHPSALLQGLERAHRILWLAATKRVLALEQGTSRFSVPFRGRNLLPRPRLRGTLSCETLQKERRQQRFATLFGAPRRPVIPSISSTCVRFSPPFWGWCIGPNSF